MPALDTEPAASNAPGFAPADTEYIRALLERTWPGNLLPRPRRTFSPEKLSMVQNSDIPSVRIQRCNDAPIRRDGDYVVYWMIAFRRFHWNYSLQRAVEWAVELNKPLVVFEPLGVQYKWACDRIHRFVLDGMAYHADQWTGKQSKGILYYPYVEPADGAGKGSLVTLAKNACLVVTDDYPCEFPRRMVAAAARKISARLESIDSNGILPLRATDRVFTVAHSFRRFLQKALPDHLAEFPQKNPLARKKLPRIPALPDAFTKRWPAASKQLLENGVSGLARMPIDHEVGPIEITGGTKAGRTRLRRFLSRQLDRYSDGANHPDDDARSGLSPYLRFGYVSAHEIVESVFRREDWTPARLASKPNGRRNGWWGLSDDAENWLDELITWRELGFNFCDKRDDYGDYDSLPEWALKTLRKHARDRREYVYSLDEFTRAETHDPLWNAAQTQLRREGHIHSYLRMLWGKKILEWSEHPREALQSMIELNNRWAIDGRDPNSYSGICWVLGRYDRAWGPERPIFGTVRYMSSDSAQKKLHLTKYLQQFSKPDDDD